MEMSDERMVELLSGHDEWHLEAVPERGLPSIMVADGPHGLRQVAGGGILDVTDSLPATCFPTASALGASWDRALLAEVGTAIAREARAGGVAVVLGPGVNIKRHPACGRNFEYLSEDPYLSGKLAASYILGVQAEGVGTSIKHFAVNNQESHRMVVDAVVDERTVRELYLRAFEIAVRTARPWTVMCAYNRLNGTFCSEHPWLLDKVLRGEWGFDGLVMTDWGAANDRVAGIRAGLDLEMPGGASAHDGAVVAALADGRLDRAAVERSVERVVALAQRSMVATTPPAPPVDFEAHHRLARRAAAASAVLLRNEGGVLPLDPGASVAVIGGMATRPRYQGGGSSRVNARTVDRAATEIRRIAREGGGRLRWAAGYDRSSGLRPDLVDAAAAVAAQADVAVVFAGLPNAWESEGFDREHLCLPEQHDRLIAAVAAANPRTVVVLANGSVVQMPWANQVAAIVEGHLGGEAVGGAMADVLYGVAEPGGRLAETFPFGQADVAADRWFPGHSRQVEYREGLLVGYRWFDTAEREVAFPFGHGLSYTSFELSDAALSAGSVEPGDELRAAVTVTNTGDRAGSTVVQVYVAALDSPVDRPAQELRAFDKVHLEPGGSARVDCALDPRTFTTWDVASQQWQTVAGAYEVRIGTSSRVIHARLPVEVASDWRPSGPVAPDSPAGPDWTVDDDTFAARLGRPLPVPDPTRPFHRNSTMGDIAVTRLGRPLVAVARKAAGLIAGSGGTEGGLDVMVDRALMELPLRSLPGMTRGYIPMRVVDALIRALNRRSARPGQG